MKSQRFENPRQKLQPDAKVQEIEKKNLELENQMKQYRDNHVTKNQVKKSPQMAKPNFGQVKKSPQMARPDFGQEVTYARLYRDPNLEGLGGVELMDVGEQERRAFELVLYK